MATTQRVIHKSLAGAEDLLQGVGTVQQSRGGQSYSIHKLDVPIPMVDVVEMQASEAEFVRLYITETETVLYRRVSTASVGDYVSNIQGYWIRVIESMAVTTATRPTTNLRIGQSVFDSTLLKPIWYTGATWVDAAGTEV